LFLDGWRAMGNSETVIVLGDLMSDEEGWQECEIKLRKKIFEKSGVWLPRKIKPEFWQKPIGRRVLDLVSRE